MKEEKTDFLETVKSGMDVLGFWQEEYREFVLKAIESRYKKEITDQYSISDILINGDKILVKWVKKFKL